MDSEGLEAFVDFWKYLNARYHSNFVKIDIEVLHRIFGVSQERLTLVIHVFSTPIYFSNHLHFTGVPAIGYTFARRFLESARE
jgi:hypothetical protein